MAYRRKPYQIDIVTLFPEMLSDRLSDNSAAKSLKSNTGSSDSNDLGSR